MNISVLCGNAQQLEASEGYLSEGDTAILECDGFAAETFPVIIGRLREKRLRVSLALPYIFRDPAIGWLGENLGRILEAGFDEILVRNPGELEYLSEKAPDGPALVTDYNVYAMNSVSSGMLKEFGASRITAPIELNERELSGLGLSDKELIVYGHLPMMFSAQCLRKNIKGCDRTPGVLYLKDRTGKRMPVQNKCPWCYNIILNALPLCLCETADRVLRMKPAVIRLSFTIEDGDTVRRVMKAYIAAYREGKKVNEPAEEYTRGHMNRGVE